MAQSVCYYEGEDRDCWVSIPPLVAYTGAYGQDNLICYIVTFILTVTVDMTLNHVAGRHNCKRGNNRCYHQSLSEGPRYVLSQ